VASFTPYGGHRITGVIGASPSSASLNGLEPISFSRECNRGSVRFALADEKWTQENIGFALSIGGLALSLALIVWFWMPETMPPNIRPHARL
jgi:hypothetical protein